MEKILQRKFIKISMSVVTIVLVTIVIVLNSMYFLQIDDDTMQIIELLAENDGRFPNLFPLPENPSSRPLPLETEFSTRYFTIKISKDRHLISVDTRNIHIVNSEEAVNLGRKVLDSGDYSGFESQFRYEIIEKEYGRIIIFVDCESELRLFENFLLLSVSICAVALFCVFILIIFVSKKAVKPIVESYNRQQQFITNVSHELKTPLAIIKTNTEVIECISESSEWTTSIHNQINRLSELVNYLIALSKMDEVESVKIKTDFSLSDALTDTIDEFTLVANNNNKTLNCKIAKNVTYFGDEQSIRMLISIIIDNSIKYSVENDEILIELTESKSKKYITVTNHAENLEIGNYDRLFERFYRLDNSRNSKTGGFGIGLAMAKTIAKKHSGDIFAKSIDGKKLIMKVEL